MKKNGRQIIALFALSNFLLSTSNADEKLNFNETIRYAIDHAPALSITRTDLQIRELEVKNAFAIFLPQLDLDATHGFQGSSPKTYNNALASDLNLRLTENIYNNGVNFTQYQSAQNRRDIAELSFKNERDKLILAISDQYFKYSLSKILAEVQEQQFAIINSNYKTVAAQFEQGARTRRDYLRFKTEVRRAEIDVENSKSNIERARLELVRLIGADQTAASTAQFTFDPLPVKIESVKSIPSTIPIVNSHYEYKITELQKEVFANDVKIVAREFWPQFYLTAGATYHAGNYLGSDDPIYRNDLTSWNALLTVKFNIFDWGIRSRNISIAEAKRNQQENEVRSRLNTFTSENAKLMLGLKQTYKQFQLSKELLDLETNSYNFSQREYRSGNISYLDIIIGLRDLLGAKIALYTSYFDLKQSLLQYHYREGNLYESIFESNSSEATSKN